MYSRKEASEKRQEFWISFGQYMRPIVSAEGEKINWVNYKTGEQHINIKMEANNMSATIGIVLSHPDKAIQQLYFAQLKELGNILNELTGEDWTWFDQEKDRTEKTTSGFSQKLEDVSVLKREDWSKIISFLKSRIIALDHFWCSVKFSFEALK